MPNIPVAFGGWKLSILRANDAQGNAASLGTLTATIDDTSKGYVAKAALGQLAVVPKAVPPAGGVNTVTITLHATSQDGTVLPDVVQAYDLQGPPEGPQAVTFFIASSSDQVGNAPADPGSATVSLL